MEENDKEIDGIVDMIEQEIVETQENSIGKQKVDSAIDEMSFLWQHVRTKLEEDKRCFSCKKIVDFSIEPLHVLPANNTDQGVVAFVSICSECVSKIEAEQSQAAAKSETLK